MFKSEPAGWFEYLYLQLLMVISQTACVPLSDRGHLKIQIWTSKTCLVMEDFQSVQPLAVQ